MHNFGLIIVMVISGCICAAGGYWPAVAWAGLLLVAMVGDSICHEIRKLDIKSKKEF